MQRWRKAYNLMLCDQNDNRRGFFFFFGEFGFVGKQKGKAYNLMQCNQKTRTGQVFFFFFFLGIWFC